jgi:hypothetical protein
MSKMGLFGREKHKKTNDVSNRRCICSMFLILVHKSNRKCICSMFLILVLHTCSAFRTSKSERSRPIERLEDVIESNKKVSIFMFLAMS